MTSAGAMYAVQLSCMHKTERRYDKRVDVDVHGYHGPIHTVAAMFRGCPLCERMKDA